MNDTEILSKLSVVLRSYSDNLRPSMSLSMARWIEMNRGGRRDASWIEQREKIAAQVLNDSFGGHGARSFWKCSHYPIATDNYFERSVCEHGCHAVEPTWHSNGMSELRETAVSAG